MMLNKADNNDNVKQQPRRPVLLPETPSISSPDKQRLDHGNKTQQRQTKNAGN
jgi:hypothetical protein